VIETHKTSLHHMARMKLLSVNVGFPREIEWQGKLVRTSNFKSPGSSCVGALILTALNSILTLLDVPESVRQIR